MNFRYVFGPVTSGRLGRSLGLDLTGEAVCSMDCLYCEAGRTEEHTLKRGPLVSARAILDELAAWKREVGVPIDVVTLGGMGEPTLNSDMPAIIAGARRILPGVPVAVLTNATLMSDAAVRAELALADMVLPSLDSLVEEEFARINRPAPGVTAQGVADAILAFAREHATPVYLEVLLLAGVNDSEENLARLTNYAAELKPARVDVTTMSRPGAHPAARTVDAATLRRWREALSAPEERRREAGRALHGAALSDTQLQQMVVNSLRRRPQTADGLVQGLGVGRTEVDEALKTLLKRRRVRLFKQGEGGDDFYGPA